MLFEDRADAGRQLAAALGAYGDSHPVVLAIPRGALPLGRVIADALGGYLDVVLVRKLGAPYNPEFAVGSVGESGHVIVAEYAARAGADSRYIEEEAGRQLATIRHRRAQVDKVHRVHRPVGVMGRTVIVVDDGMATGSTMAAALLEVRAQHPARLVCAAPVASPDAVARVRPLCDEFVCLAVESDFGGVGQFYRDFRQVEDNEVLAMLAANMAASV